MIHVNPADMQASANVMDLYMQAIKNLEVLHRRLLDLVKDALEREHILDITPNQALMLYNIGDRQLSVTELRSQGAYTGTNASYNVKKLVEAGLLCHSRGRMDRRTALLSLGQEGQKVRDVVAKVYEKHAQTVVQLGGVGENDFLTMNKTMSRLDRFWSDHIEYKM